MQEVRGGSIAERCSARGCIASTKAPQVLYGAATHPRKRLKQSKAVSITGTALLFGEKDIEIWGYCQNLSVTSSSGRSLAMALLWVINIIFI